MLKKIIRLVLTLAMVLTLGVTLASCTDDTDKPNEGNDDSTGDGKVTYTVTVKDTDGNAVSGVDITMIKVKDSGDIPMPDSYKTGADGKVEAKVNEGSWKFKVSKVPSGYILPTAVYEFADNAATVTLSLLPKYTIKVVDQNGDPVIGAMVQMCLNGGMGACIPFRNTTNEQGETSLRFAADAYQATITELPDGYTYDGGYFDFNGNADVGFTITLEVTKN